MSCRDGIDALELLVIIAFGFRYPDSLGITRVVHAGAEVRVVEVLVLVSQAEVVSDLLARDQVCRHANLL
jgi:hypothetical protein